MLGGFTKYFRSKANWVASYETLLLFQNTYPQHPIAIVAESRYWSDYAQVARGTGYADTVSAEGWQIFKERLEKAEAVLLTKKQVASSWPHWYWQLIRVQALLDQPIRIRLETFDEGVSVFPQETVIYSEMAYYFVPRWGGDWLKVKKIIELAAEGAHAEDADWVYARLYLESGKLLERNSNFFSETGASWIRIRNGLIRGMKLYPKSTLLGNAFLSYACEAEDKDFYLQYRGKNLFMIAKLGYIGRHATHATRRLNISIETA